MAASFHLALAAI